MVVEEDRLSVNLSCINEKEFRGQGETSVLRSKADFSIMLQDQKLLSGSIRIAATASALAAMKHAKSEFIAQINDKIAHLKYMSVSTAQISADLSGNTVGTVMFKGPNNQSVRIRIPNIDDVDELIRLAEQKVQSALETAVWKLTAER